MRSYRARTFSKSVGTIAALLIAASSSLVEAKSWKIKVGPLKCDLFDQQTGNRVTKHPISKNGKDTIHWDSHQKGRHIFLVFHVPKDCAAPFASLLDLHRQDAQGNELFQLGNIGTDQLDSGVVAEGCRCTCDVEPSQCELLDPQHPKRWQIKYDQYLEKADGTVEKCDGWIIVKP